MTLSTLHPSLKEALALHEALRRLGYPSAALFGMLGIDPALGPCVFVVVRYGGREFTATAGQWQGSEADFARDWTAAAETWNAASGDEAVAIYRASRLLNGGTLPLLTALTRKGMWPVRVGG